MRVPGHRAGRTAHRPALRRSREEDIRIVDITCARDPRPRHRGDADGGNPRRRPGHEEAVSIHVEHDNPAQRLYQRLGFRHVDTYGVYHLLEWRSTQEGAASAAPQPGAIGDRSPRRDQRAVHGPRLADLRSGQGAPGHAVSRRAGERDRRLAAARRCARLRVASASPSQAGKTPRREPFALYFLGPPSPILPQAIYTLRGDAVTFDQLFIVPVGRNGEGTV